MSRIKLQVLSLFLFILCFGMYVNAQDIIVPFKDTEWKFFRGQSQPPSDWKTIDFDDTSWEEGQAPIGYGDAESPNINTLISDMRNNYLSLFCRKKFQIADPFPISAILMSADYDDGFVAYLNGTRIGYRGLTITNPPYNVTATSHESGTPESISISASAVSLLQPGDNILAVQVHNTNLTSSDLFIDVELQVDFDQSSFPCVWNFACVDKGDGIVQFQWNGPVEGFLDTVEIREEGVVLAEAGGDQTELVVPGIESGDHTFRIFGTKAGAQEDCYGGFCLLTTSPIISFIRGDVNEDGSVNIVDPIFLAHYLFQDGEVPVCLDSCDSNDDGEVGIADVVGILSYLFESGTVPPAPGPIECGIDEELDELQICGYAACED